MELCEVGLQHDTPVCLEEGPPGGQLGHTFVIYYALSVAVIHKRNATTDNPEIRKCDRSTLRSTFIDHQSARKPWVGADPRVEPPA